LLSARWGGPLVVIENRPGAGTIVATAAVAKAPADGTTMLVATNSLLINPAIGQKLTYDTARELIGISMVATQPVALVATRSFPADNLGGPTTATNSLRDTVRLVPLRASTPPVALL
jgi:tripartite-type tricarboxylate transporter receptor subunit TctC